MGHAQAPKANAQPLGGNCAFGASSAEGGELVNVVAAQAVRVNGRD